MGCVSSSLLQDEDGRSIVVGPGGIGHHIVSLTSTTYGLLTTLDLPPPQIPPPSHQPHPDPPEVINAWELMAGLDPIAPPTLASFPARCPPGGETSVVLYTTTLRGIRKTFEDCNAVRSAIEGTGVSFKERDVSMDLGFREELKGLLEDGAAMSVPQLFVKGRYIGGAEAVLGLHEGGGLVGLLEGMPMAGSGGACGGCGAVRFVPCFRCSGSRKVVVGGGEREDKAVRCGACNENGLVMCPVCCEV